MCMLLYTILIIQWATIDLRHAVRISTRNMGFTDQYTNNIRLEIAKDDPNLEEYIKLYFTPREYVNNYFDHIFLVQSGQVCSERESPLLVIICLSQFDHTSERNIIRNTWGSAIVTRKWPGSTWTNATIKLVFILGILDEKTSSAERKRIAEEVITFKDIVIVDMNDNYTNLSTKVMMGLKWAQMFCPRSSFVLKVEENTFIHLPNLVKRLTEVKIPKEGLSAGFVLTNTVTVRQDNDKGFISKYVYPFYRYPLYTAGYAYVISGNAITRVISSAKRMPYVGNDDAFITGILRTVIGARLQHWDGFTIDAEKPPRPCKFHNNVRIAAMGTNIALMQTIWDSLNSFMTDCHCPMRVDLSNVTLVKLLTDTSYTVSTSLV